MLKPCRECQREVSTEARTCPHCGAVKPTSSQAAVDGGKAFRTVLVVVGVIGLLLWMTISGWFG